jgi:hypothetical protein
MENNFGLILLDLVRKNRDKFLGLLRRNGVLVNAEVGNEDLSNMILGAMKKSESFKRETALLMSVLISESDSSFSNFTSPFPSSSNIDTSPISGSVQPILGSSSSGKSSKDEKKKFEETTTGQIFTGLMGFANSYLKGKELDVRKEEARAVASTSGTTPINLDLGVDAPKKSNTGLYIGLGIGGLAIAGLIFYLVTKKK